jgi:hypothetical protein
MLFLDIVRKFQADINRITKERDEEIDQADKSAAVEKEKMEKELITKIEKNYDSIEGWRKRYERLELLPLRKQIAKINEAKKNVWKWQKTVIFITSIYIYLDFKDDFWDKNIDSSFFVEETEDLNSQVSSKGADTDKAMDSGEMEVITEKE